MCYLRVHVDLRQSINYFTWNYYLRHNMENELLLVSRHAFVTEVVKHYVFVESPSSPDTPCVLTDIEPKVIPLDANVCHERIDPRLVGQTCTICLCDITISDVVLSFVRCGHWQFHRTCAMTWLNRKTYCPICRDTIRQGQISAVDAMSVRDAMSISNMTSLERANMISKFDTHVHQSTDNDDELPDLEAPHNDTPNRDNVTTPHRVGDSNAEPQIIEDDIVIVGDETLERANMISNFDTHVHQSNDNDDELPDLEAPHDDTSNRDNVTTPHRDGDSNAEPQIIEDDIVIVGDETTAEDMSLPDMNTYRRYSGTRYIGTSINDRRAMCMKLREIYAYINTSLCNDILPRVRRIRHINRISSFRYLNDGECVNLYIKRGSPRSEALYFIHIMAQMITDYTDGISLMSVCDFLIGRVMRMLQL